MKTLVSVVMITYNHEKFIQEAIEGVLMQECNFDFELIIANDCSVDKTDEVIQNILKNHPKASDVKYIKHDKNIGMMPNFIYALQHAKREYIALCEGDDYWTDPNKLQKQVDFLEANQEYVLCFHPIRILKPDGVIVEDFITKVPENYETQETLARLGNYIHTPSVVFRNIINEFPFEFSLTPIGDYFLYMMLSEHGKLKCLNEVMAIYRYGSGVHSSLTTIKIIKSNIKTFSLLLSYSNDFRINFILFERQSSFLVRLESLVREEFSEAFVSKNFFLRNLKLIKQPKKIIKKIINKINAITQQ